MNRLIYCGDIMERVKAYVQPTDLKDALKFFKEKTGMDATMVEVAEKIVPVLEGVIPEGIELLPHGGVLTFEIWLSSPQWRGGEYTVSLTGATVGISPVGTDKPLEDVFNIPTAVQGADNDVSKLEHGGNIECGSFETKNNAVLKHPGGRPRKIGDDISRVTAWRRSKEGQGILL